MRRWRGPLNLKIFFLVFLGLPWMACAQGLITRATLTDIDQSIAGPTSFKYFSNTPLYDYGYGLVYLRHNQDPSLRRVGVLSCDGNNLSMSVIVGASKNEFSYRDYLAETLDHGCDTYALSKIMAPTSLNSAPFDLQDFENLELVNSMFYKDIARFGTLSLQHGHFTDKVYVFLPGLFLSGQQFLSQAVQKFYLGSNVIVGTYPGQETSALEGNKNNVGTWLAYTEYITRMARQYGKKVILVGQSTGGELAIRMAEQRLADGLILFQPFLGMNRLKLAAMKYLNTYPDWELGFKIPILKSTALQALKIGNVAQILLKSPHEKINIPVDILVCDNDNVVSPADTLAWAKEYAPQATIQHHKNPLRHMYVTPVNEWNQ
jgi:pimeloyl-ACP methyl ester carboxylesterase